MKKRRHLAGIDIGTTKICSTVAEVDEDGIRILGTGWAPSQGLRKGVVVNLSETIESVRNSLAQAESESETVVESAFVSVGGAYLRSFNTTGSTDVKGNSGEVTQEDVDRAVLKARSFELPEDYEIIHTLAQGFTVDAQSGITDPVGMSGRKLTVDLHVVVNACAVVQNIVNAINKAGVLVNSVVMQQLASAEAVLSEDEKEMGTVVVDLGGGTTDIIAYSQGSVRYSQVLPLGGNLVTKDIAIGLKAPLHDAEQLKLDAGSCIPESVPEEELVEIGVVGTGRNRTLSRRLLCKIIQARCDEMLQTVAQAIRRTGVQTELFTGVVLTGGCSLLDGLADRAEQILDMPVRIGYPVNLVSQEDKTFHPAYCTALGLLLYARGVQSEAVHRMGRLRQPVAGRELGATERIKNWLLEKIS